MATSGLDVDAAALGAICRRYGVARLELFGSVGRRSATADSDIDVLYVLEQGTRLGWDIEDLSDELCELFARPVDLIAKGALHPRLRKAVLAESVPLYAA